MLNSQNIIRCFILFLTFFGGSLTAQEKDDRGGVQPAEDAPIPTVKGVEVVGKRTLHSKTWFNPNSNTMTVETSAGYMHWRDRTGRFRDIDRNIALKTDSSGYAVTQGLYKSEFALNLASKEWPVVFQTHDSAFFRARFKGFAYFNSANKKMAMIREAAPAAAQVEDNKISYVGAVANVDLEYTYHDDRLKQSAYLKQSFKDELPAPPNGWKPDRTWLMMVSEIEVEGDLEGFVGDTLISDKKNGRKIKLQFEGKKRLRFKDKSGKDKFSLPEDLAFHANGKGEMTKMHRFFYEKNGKSYMITGVSLAWFNQQPAGTIVLDPTIELAQASDDVWIEHNKTTNYDGASEIRIGRNGASGWKRSLIRFDLGDIPSGAEITSASLQLYFYGVAGTPVNRTINCHQVLKNWEEGEANWEERKEEINWGTFGVGLDGVDAKATAEDAQDWNAEYPVWKSYDLTDLTQKWLDGTENNYGVILWAANEDDFTDKDEKLIYSSEYAGDPSLRPKLIVTYALNPLAEISYDALSRPDTITFANGVTEINTYDDNRGWLTRREYKRDSTNIYTFASTGAGDFDKVGNIKKITYTHKSDAADSMEYGYDNHNRLTQFTYPNDTQKNRGYTYDDNGNFKTFDGNTFRYSYDNNQLSYAHSDSFRYDAIGRTTWIDTGAANVSLTYDIFNNMTAYGATETYTYDASNQRLRKKENGDSTYYFTNGLEVLAEYDENDALQAEHIYGLGRILAKFDPAVGHKFFYSDHLGSTRLVGGSSESSDDMRRDYYPYGEELTAAGNDDTPFTFTGKELDSATDLHYFGARYYDPRIGRFLIMDRYAHRYPSLTPYHYVADNPVLFIDATGDTITISEAMANSEALQKFAQTKEGRKFLAQFAYEGQTITINDEEFTFDEAGGFSDQNLNFKGYTDEHTGLTVPVTSVGGLEFKNYVGVDGVQSYDIFIGSNMSLGWQMDALFHEVQHASMFAGGNFRGHIGRGSDFFIEDLHHGAMMQGSRWISHERYINEANSRFNAGINAQEIYINTLWNSLPPVIRDLVSKRKRVRY